MSTFKKSQSVFLISSWNDKGRVQIVPAVVHSCGKKQMVLTNATTGEELGRHFRPQEDQYNFVVVVDASADAESIAFNFGDALIDFEIRNYTRIIEKSQKASSAYRAAIAKDLEAMKVAESSIFWA
jgi:hypothetical protein